MLGSGKDFGTSEMLVGMNTDLFKQVMAIAPTVMTMKDFDGSKKAAFAEGKPAVMEFLQKYQKFLLPSGDRFTASGLTFGEIHLFACLYCYANGPFPEVAKGELSAFYNRMAAVPGIKTVIEGKSKFGNLASYLQACPSMNACSSNNPPFSDEEMLARTVTLKNLPLSCTGKELIDFFNGAILAVTQNGAHLAAHSNMDPVFACTVTEEECAGGGGKRKSAQLKFRTSDGASVGMKLNGIEHKGHKVTVNRPEAYEKPANGQDPSDNINLSEVTMAKLVGSASTSGSGDGLTEVMTEQI